MSFVPKFGIGQSVPRTEDPRLLRGGGRYTDDVAPEGVLIARFLRSDHAHGVIRRLDVAAAARLPGVRLVLTDADLAAIYDYLHLVAARKAKAARFYTLNVTNFTAIHRPGDPEIEHP